MSSPKSTSEGQVEVKMWVKPAEIKDLQNAGYRPELQYPADQERPVSPKPVMGQCAPPAATPKSDGDSTSTCEVKGNLGEASPEAPAPRGTRLGRRLPKRS